MAVVRADDLIALDANFLIGARAAASSEGRHLEEWLRIGAIILASTVAWSEYLCGPINKTDLEITRKFLSRIEPFAEEEAELASDLFNQTGRRSRSHADCMIAAHAIRRHAFLATLNVRDFQRFENWGLRLAQT